MKAKYIIWLWILIFVGCQSQQQLDRTNLAYLYQQEGMVLKPVFYVYHSTPDRSTVYFEGSGDQLLYIKEPGYDDYMARVNVRYRLYSDYQRTALLDSGSTLITDQRKQTGLTLVQGSVELKYPPTAANTNYILEITFTDVNRGVNYTNVLRIDRTDKQSRQNFLLRTPSGKIVYRNHYPVGVPLRLSHRLMPEHYMVKYYDRDFPLAQTPYAKNEETTFSMKPDSVFRVNANDTIVLPKKGFYHFQLDESTKAGFTIFSFYNEYPLITRKINLGEPLRYITTKEEFASIKRNDPDSMKIEVDKFWLRTGGNVDKAKQLISAFYNRVETANLLFTSYMEGWKTDRGIIYIMLGEPSEVYRTAYQETWIYGNPSSTLPYTYVFTRVNNPFSDNDYGLIRQTTYRYGWSLAVESWRNGNIFGLKEIKRAQDERDQQSRIANQPYFWY